MHREDTETTKKVATGAHAGGGEVSLGEQFHNNSGRPAARALKKLSARYGMKQKSSSSCSKSKRLLLLLLLPSTNCFCSS